MLNQICAPGQPDTQSAQRSSTSARNSAQHEHTRWAGANAGTSPSRAAPRPVSRMGSTSQSTAAPDTSAYRLVLIPHSTSTGKVAMEAQAEMQTVSHRLPANPSAFRFQNRRRGRFFFARCFSQVS